MHHKPVQYVVAGGADLPRLRPTELTDSPGLWRAPTYPARDRVQAIQVRL